MLITAEEASGRIICNVHLYKRSTRPIHIRNSHILEKGLVCPSIGEAIYPIIPAACIFSQVTRRWCDENEPPTLSAENSIMPMHTH